MLTSRPTKMVAAALSISFLAACSSAPKATEVSASFVPVGQYANMSCSQLLITAESLRSTIPGLEAQVNNHRSNQTAIEVVTWLLFWPAAFALDKGEGYSSQLARAKGELDAVNLALRTQKC